jgi:hypothetical protein
MPLQVTTALRDGWLDDIVAAVGTSGLIRVYTGALPANVAAAASGTLLGTLTCSATLGTVSGGVLTFSAVTQDSSADATGTAGYFRLTTSGGTAVAQGDVGTSGADMNLNTVSIVAGGPISVTSATITAPGA